MKFYYAFLVAMLSMVTLVRGQNHPLNSDGSIIDLLVIYNTETFSQFGENESTTAWIDEAIESNNASLRNSGINLRLDLVHKQLVSYNSTGTTSGDLDALQSETSSLGMSARALRDQYHADVVLLIVPNLGGGRNNLLLNIDSPEAAEARFGVVRAGATSVLVHEFGHTMGIAHDEPDASQPGGFERAIFPYAHGYSGGNFTPNTIVGGFQYESNPNLQGYGKIPFYSNPNLRFRNAPLGDASYADAARTMNETSPVVAKVRNSEVVWTGNAGSDWSSSANWSTGSVPRNIDDVVIPSGLSTYPSINGGSATARNLIIAEGAQLNMSDGQLELRGHLIAEGSFQATGGDVILKSNLDKAIMLQLSSSSTLNNLNIGDTDANTLVKLESAAKVNGNIIIKKASVLDHNNKMIQVSGDWNDEWGCGFDYSYDGVNLSGEINVMQDAVSFSIGTTNGPFSSEEAGWGSITEFGQKAYSWFFGGTEGQLWVNNNRNFFQDLPEYQGEMDAWAFTPSIFLAQNNEYEITYQYRANDSQLPTKPQISTHFGDIQLPSNMQSIGSTISIVTDNNWQDVSNNLRSTSAGAKNIGIRFLADTDVTDALATECRIRNISVKCASEVPEDFGNSDACTDTDEDGVCDADDNCPDTANEDQADSDGDGIGDVCEEEVCPEDTDGDGVCDDDDNCPAVSNPDQADSDGDGVGDACEESNCESDTDEDGICDEDDNCPMTANPDQADSDEDGIGDVCEEEECNVEVGEIEDVIITVGGVDVPINITTPPTGQAPFTYRFSLAGANVGPLFPTEVVGVDPNDPSTYPVASPSNISDFFMDRGIDGNTFYDIRVIDNENCESEDPLRIRVDFIFDMDGDGTSDANDNRPETANPDQADSDGDGIGDVCDEPSTGNNCEVIWQLHHGQGAGIFTPGPDDPSVEEILNELTGGRQPVHGDPGGFQYAMIPPTDDADWEAAPIDEDGDLCWRLDRSRLTGGFMALDFTYFQTSVFIDDASVPFILRFYQVDDGARAYVFNSAHPDGEYIVGGDARIYASIAETDISPLFIAGEENRIVIVQFDDSQTENYLKVEVTGCDGGGDPCANAAPLDLNSGITRACDDGSILGSINITVMGGVEPYIFGWSNGATTEDIEELLPGDYTVTVTDNCGSIDEFTINLPNSGEDICGGINNDSEVDKFKIDKTHFALNVSPNPFREETQIKINLSQSEWMNIEMRDISGRTVKSLSQEGFKGTNSFFIQRNDLTSGVYFISVRTATTQQTVRVIITQ